jgi:hypothetical protein
MLLGDLLTRFTDEGIATEALLALGDLSLLASLRDEAAARGLEVGAFAADAVRQYAAHASDEEWVTLLAAMNRDPDPGMVCFRRALAHALGHRDLTPAQ